ncbi:MAG TPA: signal peptidase I [Leptospiraceae bacterium]|nr:signal peptidase I [Spirochaetaceae bacterium]HBS06077.1 signal peptidase I [Leptospiraceae bacterium]|tara:strand:- start:7940 stop:8512 length:573 start_codon:yes stop_codon:yes gene_type:complete
MNLRHRDLVPNRERKIKGAGLATGLVLAVLLGLLVRWIIHGWFIYPLEIPDEAMAPASDMNLKTGEVVYVSRMIASEDLKPGAVVVFRHPDLEDTRMIRRIAATPGQTVEIRDGRLYVNGNLIQETFQEVAYQALTEKRPILADSAWDQMPPLRLGDGEYFLLADNRYSGLDSRFFGPVPASRIQGLISP